MAHNCPGLWTMKAGWRIVMGTQYTHSLITEDRFNISAVKQSNGFIGSAVND